MCSDRTRARWAELLDFAIDPNSSRPLFQQIHRFLQEAIVAGRLSPGERLPSTRQLADRLGLSRTSTLSAYQQLFTEGYIEARIGSGTFVANDLPKIVGKPDSIENRASGTKRAQPLSTYAAKAAKATSDLYTTEAVPFVTGCCSIDAAGIDAWRRIGVRQLQTMDGRNLRYSDPSGDPELRVEVANYLRAARAVRCDPDHILIVSGAQQGIDLTIRTLIDRGDAVWIEDPGYLPTRAALSAQGAQLVPVPVDREGLVVSTGIERCAEARAAYITPSHQYPTGSVMSLERRLTILDWANRAGSWVVEDDYDSEFRYVGNSLSSLQGMDDNHRVIYIGTLSKVLFPGIRVGFMVVPAELKAAIVATRFLSDRQPATLQQRMVAEFMREGFLTSHIRRMRQRYREARDVLIAVLLEQLDDLIEIEIPEGGIQLSLFFKQDLSDQSISAAAKQQGIYVRALSSLYLEAVSRKGLLLGFSGFEPNALRAAATHLARIIRDHASK
jgi:GntR family transcriptional regulator/MocR family aminotransferase